MGHSKPIRIATASANNNNNNAVVSNEQHWQEDNRRHGGVLRRGHQPQQQQQRVQGSRIMLPKQQSAASSVSAATAATTMLSADIDVASSSQTMTPAGSYYNNNNNAPTTTTPSRFSKSLGDSRFHRTTALHRHMSEISRISHAGYLLKRCRGTGDHSDDDNGGSGDELDVEGVNDGDEEDEEDIDDDVDLDATTRRRHRSRTTVAATTAGTSVGWNGDLGREDDSHPTVSACAPQRQPQDDSSHREHHRDELPSRLDNGTEVALEAVDLIAELAAVVTSSLVVAATPPSRRHRALSSSLPPQSRTLHPWDPDFVRGRENGRDSLNDRELFLLVGDNSAYGTTTAASPPDISMGGDRGVVNHHVVVGTADLSSSSSGSGPRHGLATTPRTKTLSFQVEPIRHPSKPLSQPAVSLTTKTEPKQVEEDTASLLTRSNSGLHQQLMAAVAAASAAETEATKSKRKHRATSLPQGTMTISSRLLDYGIPSDVGEEDKEFPAVDRGPRRRGHGRHAWRAVYCVLEGGTLYFYRYQSDAEEPEARAERRQQQQEEDEAQHEDHDHTDQRVGWKLNSIMTPQYHHHGDAEIPPLSSSKSPHHNNQHYWEKRVPLDCVGAVRSAELEHGPHSFELSAVRGGATIMGDGDDDGGAGGADAEENENGDRSTRKGSNCNNKLVLRARNAEEMNEWLFQFHRSIATFVRDIMDHVSHSSVGSINNGDGDIHHTDTARFPIVGSVQASTSTALTVFSPRVQKLLIASTASSSSFSPSPTVPSLSHGHGRSSLHRRRMGDAATTSLSNNSHLITPQQRQRRRVPLPPSSPLASSVPRSAKLSTTLIASEGRQQQSKIPLGRLIPPNRRCESDNNRGSSYNGSSYNGSSYNKNERIMDASPEHSAPRSRYPETERPPPSSSSPGGSGNGRKYVPPHLRKGGSAMNQSAATAPSAEDPSSGAATSDATIRRKYVPPHLRRAAASALTTTTGTIATASLATSTTSISWSSPSVKNGSDVGTHSPGRRTDRACPSSQADYIPRRFEHATTSLASTMAGDSESSTTEIMVFGDAEMGGCVDADECVVELSSDDSFKLGGCADPSVVSGSITDPMYIPRKASRLGKVRTDPYGYVSTRNDQRNTLTGSNHSRLDAAGEIRWEIGAVSECGVRDSNEDSYLVVQDLSMAAGATCGSASTVWDNTGSDPHAPGLFAIFDGHCGDQAARFAAERLAGFIYEESIGVDHSMEDGHGVTRQIEDILRGAISKLDAEFCDLCIREGRAWESGATALVAALVNQQLVIANVGDARGVMSKSVSDPVDCRLMEGIGWTALPFDDCYEGRRCLWKEVADVHSPSREDERLRIQQANGWITTEKEIPVGQLQRMVLGDEDVIDILQRCFADRYDPSPKAAAPQRILKISRVCGELAVSRSIGDRDFKASCNSVVDSHDHEAWDCPLLLPYPEDHSRRFVGDLVTNEPDFQTIAIGDDGVSDEFLLLACDGLWDVMDADDAVRVTRDLLFVRRWPAKKAAGRLAELAIHLGSSDNITVIVVRFFEG